MLDEMVLRNRFVIMMLRAVGKRLEANECLNKVCFECCPRRRMIVRSLSGFIWDPCLSRGANGALTCEKHNQNYQCSCNPKLMKREFQENLRWVYCLTQDPVDVLLQSVAVAKM